jgi:hypothetical protein
MIIFSRARKGLYGKEAAVADGMTKKNIITSEWLLNILFYEFQ